MTAATLLTKVLPDLDTATLEQLQPPCEAKIVDRWLNGRPSAWHGCEAAADWIGRSRCVCGHAFLDLLCTQHRRMVEQSRVHRSCLACGRLVEMRGVQWEEIRASASRGGS